MELPDSLLRFTLPGKARADFYDALAVYLGNRLNMVDALDLLGRRMRGSALFRDRVPAVIRERLQAGQSLPAALDGLIPEEEILVIAAGNEVGKQVETLHLAAEMVRLRQNFLDTTVKWLSYPVLLALLFVIILLIVALAVVPTLEELVPPARWTGSPRILHDVSSFVASWNGVAAGVLVVLVAAAVLWSLAHWTSRKLMDEVPPWSLYRLLHAGLWLLTLSILLRGGMQTARALELLRERAGFSPWLQRRVDAVCEQYAQGKDLGQAMADTGYRFPNTELVQEFRLYASLPGFPERLYALTRVWLDRNLEFFAKICRMISGTSILVILFLLAGIGIAVRDLITLMGEGGGMF